MVFRCFILFYTAAGVRTEEGSLELCLTKDDLLNVIKNWTEIRTNQEIERHQLRWNVAGSIFFAITVVTTIGEFCA